MKYIKTLYLLLTITFLTGCNGDDDSGTTVSGTELSEAFGEFDTNNMTIYLDGDDIVIETNGLPNHTSPYWSNTTARSRKMAI